MATVYFDKAHTKIVDLFGDSDSGKTKKIFSSNYEFMIFAAMIGRSLHTSCENVKINGGKEIKDSYFGDKEDVAYLLALDGAKNGEIMRSGNENEIWKYLENYAYLGCEEINKWIMDSPIDDLHEVVLNKIMEAAIPLAKKEEA
tara:strand:- start:18 stop:449 length:432 start_codon:yes stop_codon:yes gene_type:complete